MENFWIAFFTFFCGIADTVAEFAKYMAALIGRIIFYNLVTGFASLAFDTFMDKDTAWMSLIMTTAVVLICELFYQIRAIKKGE